MVKVTVYSLERTASLPSVEIVYSVITPTVAPSDGSAIGGTYPSGSYEIGEEKIISSSPFTLSTQGSLKCNTTGGNITVNLPSAASANRKLYCITNIGPNNVIITRAGADTVDGSTTVTLVGANKWWTGVSNGVSSWSSSIAEIEAYFATMEKGVTSAGTSGESLFHQVIDGSYQLRSLTPASSKVSMIYNQGTASIDCDVVTNDSGASAGDLWSAEQVISHSLSFIESYTLVDSKDPGTPGGTATAGDWFPRLLNLLTKIPEESKNITLSEEGFTLAPGRYTLSANVPGYGVDSHQARLYNMDHKEPMVYGSVSRSPSRIDSSQSLSTINHVFILTESTMIRVEQIVETSSDKNGLGLPGGFRSPEIYTSVLITKIG